MLNSRAGKFTAILAVLVLLATAVSTVSLLSAQDTGAGSIDSVRGSFTSFQNAIDNSQDGDVITVGSGIYVGNFVIEVI